MKSPLVSVVIPVYNRSHLISKTLDSINEQSYPHLEVIVVDDCSDDSESLKFEISKYTELEIKYIRHEINKHGGASRNTGIDNATGEYIAFLDSDDLWVKDKIATCLNEIQSSEEDVVYSKFEYVKKDNTTVFPRRSIGDNESISDYILLNNGAIQTSTIFLNRKVTDLIRFDDSLKRFQDYDFVISLQRENIKIKFIDKSLVKMTDDDQEGRISNSYNPEPAIKWIEKVKKDISREAYSYFYLNRVVRYCKMSGDIKLVFKILMNSEVFNHSKKTSWCKWLVIACTPISIINIVK